MTVTAYVNKYGLRWFTSGPIKIVLRSLGRVQNPAHYTDDQRTDVIEIGNDPEKNHTTPHVNHTTSHGAQFKVRGTDIDDLEEVLTHVQRVRKEGKPPLVAGKPGEEWRDVAADMIRSGADYEALVVIGEHSPTNARSIMQRKQYLDVVESFINQLAVDHPLSTLPTHDLQVTWANMQRLRQPQPPASEEEKYAAIGKMERARTAMREAAWRYIDAGREITLGLELDHAARQYTTAYEDYERIK